VLPVEGLERFVERDRVPRRSLRDGLVRHPELAQLEAALDEAVEAQQVDGGVVRYPVDGSVSLLLSLFLRNKPTAVPSPVSLAAAPVSYPPGGLRRIRRRAYHA
jgi:hypothetical protein